MQRIRIASAIAAVLLLVAAEARAECAWVLWHVRATVVDSKVPFALTEYRVEGAWYPAKGFEAAKDCDAALKEADSAEFDNMLRRKDLGRYLYRCLPDTIDPRGPKGK